MSTSAKMGLVWILLAISGQHAHSDPTSQILYMVLFIIGLFTFFLNK